MLANSERGDCGEFGVPVNLRGQRPKVAIARSNQGEGRHASKKRVSAPYQHYSPLGIKGRRLCPSAGADSSAFVRYGNFLSYAARAQKAFPNDPIAPDEAKIYRKIKRWSAR